MAIPRCRIFDRTKPVTCHCVSRCVRRANLLAPNERKEALRERLAELSRFFAIDVLEWSLLSNHFHLVASTHPDLASLWSDEEVARRYRTLSPDYAWRRANRVSLARPAQQEEIDDALAKPELIKRWREDLADLSTFHKFLKQKLARVINLAEDVTGHCFEGRFKSIVALDEEAIIAHMVYVALNPVRASMADSLESYEFCSIAPRVEELKRRIADGEFAGEAEAARRKLYEVALQPAIPCTPGERAKEIETLPDGRTNPWFGGGRPSLLRGEAGRTLGAIGLASYLTRVDASGRAKHRSKSGVISPSTPSPLKSIERILAPAHYAAHSKSPPEAVPESEWDSSWDSTHAMIEAVDLAMADGSSNPRGHFSGSPESIARAARDTGRRSITAIAGLMKNCRSRVSAEEDENAERVARKP